MESQLSVYRRENGRLSLYRRGSANRFGTLFGILLLLVKGEKEAAHKLFEQNTRWLMSGLEIYEKEIGKGELAEKRYSQYLSFMISVGWSVGDGLDELGIISERALHRIDLNKVIDRAVEGTVGYGNKAMFIAQYALLMKRMGSNKGKEVLDMWLERHLEKQNRIGLWGNTRTPYKMVQNGYHQVEILDYLGLGNEAQKDLAAKYVWSYQGRDLLWTPYPGGSPCYDYDAIYFLLRKTDLTDQETGMLKSVLQKVESMRRSYGGFCENSFLGKSKRAKRFGGLLGGFYPYYWPSGVKEKSRWLTLVRGKFDNNILYRHWDSEVFDWDEENLWAGFFRELAIERLRSRLLKTDERVKISGPGLGSAGQRL